MTRVIVNSDVAVSLGGLAVATEFCDPSGKTLGFFQPVNPPSLKYLDMGISEEELRLREQDRSGRTLDQILADLEGGG